MPAEASTAHTNMTARRPRIAARTTHANRFGRLRRAERSSFSGSR